MASLDEFFAKKDKNKRGKKNKLTPEELAKQLESRGSSVHHRKKDHDDLDRGSGLISNSKLLFQDQDDEEWKEFEDNREKDYRGLKIVSLNMKDKEEEMLEKQRAQDKINEKPIDESGPWNKRTASPVPSNEDSKPEIQKEEIVKEDHPKTEPVTTSTGGIGGEGSGKARYVPPALRNATATDNVIRPTTMAAAVRKLPKGSLPKMDDAQDFPSLSLG